MQFKIGDRVRFKNNHGDQGYMFAQFGRNVVNEFIVTGFRNDFEEGHGENTAFLREAFNAGNVDRASYFKRLELIAQPNQGKEMNLKDFFASLPSANDMQKTFKYANGEKVYLVMEMYHLFSKGANPLIYTVDRYNNAIIRQMMDQFAQLMADEGSSIRGEFNNVRAKGFGWSLLMFSRIPVKFDKAGRPRCRITGKPVSYEAMGWPKNMRLNKEVMNLINDVPPAPAKPKKEEPKPVPDVREALNKALEGKKGGVCSYAVQYPNGKIKLQPTDICHARIGHDGQGAINVALNVAVQERGLKEKLRPIYREWVRWMLNESPVAFCFITKDVNEAFDKGILMNVDVTASQLALAAVVLRTAHEHKYLPLWDKLKEEGVHPFFAWMGCSVLNHHIQAFLPNYHYGWHHVISILASSVQDVKRFFHEGPLPINNVPYKLPNAGHYSINKSFGMTKGGIEAHFSKHFVLSKKEVEDGWGGKKMVETVDLKSIVMACQDLQAICK